MPPSLPLCLTAAHADAAVHAWLTHLDGGGGAGRRLVRVTPHGVAEAAALAFNLRIGDVYSGAKKVGGGREGRERR